MQALVYHGPDRKQWESKPDPKLEHPSDAIVQIDTATICGTDLHILKGDVPSCAEGRTLGHEAVGTVVETGDAVENLRQGDRVLVSCISACGRCRYCREGMYGQCQNGGGWILGHLIDGTQAELARIPFADNSLYKVPEGLSDEQVLFLSDILPTGFEVGVLNGNVRPGDVVAVVGAGPVGLAAMMTARLYGPSRIVAIDKADSRLEKARSQFGADVTVNSDSEDPAEVIMGLSDGLGADVAIEAVGIPETFELCADLVRPGGRVANIGVHGNPPPGAPLDPQHHHHHWPGRHPLHPDPPPPRRRGPPRPAPVRHPPLPPRPDHGGVRRLRRRRQDQRPQDGPHQILTLPGVEVAREPEQGSRATGSARVSRRRRRAW
jgi:alcohol dehydrogenase